MPSVGPASDVVVDRSSRDPIGVCLSVIDNGLRLLRMDAGAAGRIGLTGFHPCAGHPFAAQLWLASMPGAFGVEVLADHAHDPRVPANALRADLLVRHYPDPADATFADLSEDERRLRRGGGFHASGAPGRRLTQDLFGTPLFGAGALCVARDRAGTVASLHGLSGTAAGFRAVAAVLDALVTTLAFVHHTRPQAVVPYAEPARRQGRQDGRDPNTCDTTQDGYRLGLQVVLPVNLTQPGYPPASDDDPEVMRFTTAAWAAAEPADPSGSDARLPASAMRARWWTARDWLAQPGAAPCACCAEGAEVEHPHHHGHAHDHDHDHDHGAHTSHQSSEGTS